MALKLSPNFMIVDERLAAGLVADPSIIGVIEARKYSMISAVNRSAIKAHGARRNQRATSPHERLHKLIETLRAGT